MTIGVGSHGKTCCPHVIIGIFITGSPNVGSNIRSQIRVGDITSHTCPHCPIGMAIGGSGNVLVNRRGGHRIGDTVTEFCGSGTSVTGSPNVRMNG